MLDGTQNPGGSYREHCLEVGVTLEMGVFGHVVCDVAAAAKNNPGTIQRVVGVRRGKLDGIAYVSLSKHSRQSKVWYKS